MHTSGAFDACLALRFLIIKQREDFDGSEDLPRDFDPELLTNDGKSNRYCKLEDLRCTLYSTPQRQLSSGQSPYRGVGRQKGRRTDESRRAEMAREIGLRGRSAKENKLEFKTKVPITQAFLWHS